MIYEPDLLTARGGPRVQQDGLSYLEQKVRNLLEICIRDVQQEETTRIDAHNELLLSIPGNDEEVHAENRQRVRAHSHARGYRAA